MTRSIYVGPEWPDGGPEPEATSHFYCANDECPSSFGNGHGPVPNTRKYQVPGGYICELCAEAHDTEIGDIYMIDLIDEIRRTHQLEFTWQLAGSERKDDARTVWQKFEIQAYTGGGDRGAKLNIFVTDDVAAGILRPDDHPHYPLTGEPLLVWKLWTTVFDDADQQIMKAPEDRDGYWRYAEHLFTRDGLVKLLALYRQLVKVDVEADIPIRARYVHESGHRLANTGRGHNNNPHGTFLFRCVDCKRLARVADFREHECWIPMLLDLEHRDDFQQLAFRFADPDRANKYGSPDFAIWHRGATSVALYEANGFDRGTLDVAAGIEFDDLLAAVIDKWGPLASVQFSTLLYPSGE
ncbi:hypothetical protein [Streptomyces sp. NPDC088775]|uniref:hypothetical protein n=1 Tax=Streptomyces sp. NPDC088775 TaxID=3365896 RepID=UPI00382CC325